MQKTFSGLISYAQDGAGDTSTTIKTFLKKRINERYEVCTDKLNTWKQEITRTFTTGTAAGADQQYYYNPPNLREISSLVLTKSSQDYILTPCYSQREWDLLNATVISSDYPRRYFKRANDFGIWPIPNEDDYTATLVYTQRAVPLYFEDYTTGTAVVTVNDQTVTLAGGGSTSTFKPGFWFTLTDSGGEPRGTPYKILSITDSANFELETYFEETTESGVTYLVGQIPEIPEEGQLLPAIGAISDFYGLKQKDMETATKFDNRFWTGNYNVTPLQAKKDGDYGGLLALADSYKDRDQSKILDRELTLRNPLDFRTPQTGTL